MFNHYISIINIFADPSTIESLKRDRRESITSLPGTAPPKEKRAKIEEIRPLSINEIEGKQDIVSPAASTPTPKASFSPKQKFTPIVPPSKTLAQTEESKSISIGMSSQNTSYYSYFARQAINVLTYFLRYCCHSKSDIAK